MHLFEALLLGVIEGLTEFLPVSSTGHLLLVGHFLGFESTGKTFEVLIQLGAIIAILSPMDGASSKIARDLPYDPDARRFVLGVLVAFLPGSGGRGGVARLHQGCPVQPVDRLRDADRSAASCFSSSTT